MSLHPDIQNLADQGRNGDSMLLHVTPSEIHGLHQLAQMHGTKMTVNPVTGLHEANFMKDWLPAIVGGVATVATGGLAAPLMIGAGALTAFGTSMAVGNNFKKSLLQGLFAGAGGALGAGLGGLGAVGAEGLAAGASGLGARTALTLGADEIAAQGMKAAALGGARAITPEIAAQAGAGTLAEMGSAIPGAATKMFSNEALAGQAAARTEAMLARQGTSAAAKSFMPSGSQMFGAPALPPTGAQNYAAMGIGDRFAAQGAGINRLFTEPGLAGQFAGNNKLALAGMGVGAIGGMMPDRKQIKPASAHGEYYSYPGFTQGYDPTGGASGQQYFNYDYGTPTITPYATGGSVGASGNDVMYPQSQLPPGAVGQYGNMSAVPVPREVVGSQDAVVDPRTGEENAVGSSAEVVHMADGGIATLGGYSDGGRLTQGPGDGVSDSIPASIGGKQPARLADGEFVIPARIVSEIGNGSTKAGAKKLYAMMDRIQKARRKTKDIAANTRADRFMPA